MLEHTIPRRSFLKKMSLLGGAGLTALIVPPRPNAFASLFLSRSEFPFYKTRGGRVMLEKLTHDVFREFLGDRFDVRVETGRSVRMELIEAKNLKTNGGGGGTVERAPFSIVFRAPKDVLVPQKIYPMKHEKMGSFDIFLVPIGPDEKGMRYEAIFA